MSPSRTSSSSTRGCGRRGPRRSARPRACRSRFAVEDRVDLDDLQRTAARTRRRLHGEVRLAVGEPAAHRRTDARRDVRIDHVHVELSGGSRADACASASRMRLEPSRSISLIVKTFSERRSSSRSPSSRERVPTSASAPDRPPAASSRALERVAGEPERGGQRHPVDVARRRGRGRVQVAVGVDPEDAARAVDLRSPPRCRSRPSGRRRGRAAAPRADRVGDRAASAPAERGSGEVARVAPPSAVVSTPATTLPRSPTLCRAPRAPVEPRVADRGRPHVDAAASGPRSSAAPMTATSRTPSLTPTAERLTRARLARARATLDRRPAAAR